MTTEMIEYPLRQPWSPRLGLVVAQCSPAGGAPAPAANNFTATSGAAARYCICGVCILFARKIPAARPAVGADRNQMRGHATRTAARDVDLWNSPKKGHGVSNASSSKGRKIRGRDRITPPSLHGVDSGGGSTPWGRGDVDRIVVRMAEGGKKSGTFVTGLKRIQNPSM